MATLTVWKFPTPHGGDEAEYTLEELQKQGFIQVHDAAIVTWEFGSKQPSTRQLKSAAGKGPLGRVFRGMFSGSRSDVGFDDEFIKTVRDKVTPGTSALFLMTSDAVLDRVGEALSRQDMELISTNLSAEQEKALREAFPG